MSLVSNSDMLKFLGISQDSVKIDSSNDTIYFKYDAGSSTAVILTQSTYSISDLCTQIKSKIDTAFTIASTVTYSSTTRKVTIAVSAGHTIQYINTGSDAGLTLGFTEDSTAALSITSDSEIVVDPSTEVLELRDAIEAYIQKECRRTFASTTHTLERYDGTGNRYLYVKNYPITNVAQLSIGTQDGIWLWNTSTDTLATVSVTSTAVVLNKDGASDTLLFSDYATLALIAAAISSAGDGWQAQVISSTYNSYKSTQLIKRFGASAINNNYVYLQIPYTPLYNFEVYENEGKIYYSGGFGSGRNNVFITYTAGYSTVPDDLQYLIKVAVKHNYNISQNGFTGLSAYRLGDLSFTFDKGNESSTYSIPKEVTPILAKYKKRLV